MTWLSRMLSLFPTFVLALAGGCLFEAIRHAGSPLGAGLWWLALACVLYLLPPLAFRLHDFFLPLKEGVSSLTELKYNAWWGGHQIQSIYISLPWLEGTLRLVPGAYSAWLRLWGAKIGQSVYWTPQVEVIDRPLLVVGNGVVFGHQVVLCSHVVANSRGGLLVKRIEIGERSMIGARSRLGPGVRVAPRLTLPYNTEGWINQVFDRSPAPNRSQGERP